MRQQVSNLSVEFFSDCSHRNMDSDNPMYAFLILNGQDCVSFRIDTWIYWVFWDNEKQKAKAKAKNAVEINNFVRFVRLRINRIYADAVCNNVPDLTADKLRLLYQLECTTRKEWVEIDPETGAEVRVTPPNKDHLELFELGLIEEYESPNEELCQARDVFLLSCYMSKLFSEIRRLKVSDIKFNDESKYISFDKPVPHNILITDEIETIFRRYDNHPCRVKSEVLIPLPKHTDVVRYLDALAIKCGIKKQLTQYIGGRTFKAFCHYEKQWHCYPELVNNKYLNHFKKVIL